MDESDTRSVNMQLRRERILKEARRVIGEQGYEALSLRRLAMAAGVTTPTIYNLIGSKEELLATLLDDLLTKLEAQLSAFDGEASTLEHTEAIVLRSAALLGEDESFYRAAIIVGQQLDRFKNAWGKDGWIFKRSVQISSRSCEAGLAEGLLCGRLSAEVLGDHIYAVYRANLYDWVFGLISLEEFKISTIQGFYLCLMADATETFHAVLKEKIEALETQRKNARLADKAA